MTITLQQLSKRLEKSPSVLQLEKEIDKQHIFEILKCVKNKPNGISHSQLREISKKEKSLKFSFTYLTAYLRWLKENGYLIGNKRMKQLSGKGEKALLELEDCISPLETTLKVNWGLSNTEVEARLKGKIEDITKTAIFSREYIKNRILELCACLSISSEALELNIRIPPVESNKIFGLLKLMWSFYWRKVADNSVAPNPLGPLFINMDLANEKNKRKYTEFWKDHLEKYSQLKDIEIIEYSMVGKEKACSKPHLFKQILPQGLEGLLTELIKDEEVKRWIENQLEKDADWFMPHPIWVELGFKRRRENIFFESVDHVSPPVFHEVTSPELPNEYGVFDTIFRDVIQKKDENGVKAFCFWIKTDGNWKSQGFYKSWRIIREEHEQKINSDLYLRGIAQILDQALCGFIGANHNPTVNLAMAFDDFLNLKDAEKIIIDIRKGKYTLN
jgi:hypothetical protein